MEVSPLVDGLVLYTAANAVTYPMKSFYMSAESREDRRKLMSWFLLPLGFDYMKLVYDNVFKKEKTLRSG